MEIKNCRSCRRLFNYLSGPQICPACAAQLEEKFHQVKEYLREHPDASMESVTEDNDVSVKQIRQWVREERLTFSDKSPVGLECEMCGKMIKTGRYCADCKAKMKNNLVKGIEMPEILKPERKSDSKSRMRYLD